MNLEISPIDVNRYESEREKLVSLAKSIWEKSSSFNNAVDSLDRWGNSKKESGTYFYILQDKNPIGITGYYRVDTEKGWYGLRHHGTMVRGTGKPSLDLLVDYIREHHPDFRSLIEQIPEGREELIEIFERWGFHLIEIDQSWEPKKEYYKYVMARDN